MGLLGGGILKLLQTVFYALEFGCSGIILGIYSWFLWWNNHNTGSIPTWQKAVEGLSGAAALYCIFAVLLTCFLGGISFFAFIAIVLDVLFCGALIAIAVMARHGAGSCSHNAFVRTPIGNGLGSTDIPDATDLSFACRLNTAAFAVAIIGAFLFAISALLQVAIARNHKKEKAFGPSPKNNYTKGSGNKWFSRRSRKAANNDVYAKDAEAGAVGGGLAAPAHHDTTAPVANGGYHTQPAVNPYGYDNTARPTNF